MNEAIQKATLRCRPRPSPKSVIVTCITIGAKKYYNTVAVPTAKKATMMHTLSRGYRAMTDYDTEFKNV